MFQTRELFAKYCCRVEPAGAARAKPVAEAVLGEAAGARAECSIICDRGEGQNAA